MNCSFPTPLNEDELVTAIDNVADDAVKQHLKECAYCREQLELTRQAIRDFDVRLRNVVFRLECPPSMTFVELFFDRLASAENLKIRHHLDICPHCRKDYADLRQFMRITEPTASKAKPRSRVGQIVAALLPAPDTQRRAYNFRGDSSGFVFEAEGTTIFLTPQQRATGRYLAGQVMTVSEVNNWVRALVELRQNAELKATAVIDENGRFTCPLVIGEAIELRITNDQSQSILVKGIELRE